MANAARSVRRGVGGASPTAGDGTGPAGQDPVRASAAEAARPVYGRAVADAAAEDQTLACERGSGERGVLRAAAPAGPTVPIGLHALPRAGNHDRWRGVSPPDLPLRAELLELGDGQHLLFGKFRELERRLAEGAVGVGRSASGAPLGSDECGGEQSDRPKGVHPKLRIVAGALRIARPEDSSGASQ